MNFPQLRKARQFNINTSSVSKIIKWNVPWVKVLEEESTYYQLKYVCICGWVGRCAYDLCWYETVVSAGTRKPTVFQVGPRESRRGLFSCHLLQGSDNLHRYLVPPTSLLPPVVSLSECRAVSLFFSALVGTQGRETRNLLSLCPLTPPLQSGEDPPLTPGPNCEAFLAPPSFLSGGKRASLQALFCYTLQRLNNIRRRLEWFISLINGAPSGATNGFIKQMHSYSPKRLNNVWLNNVWVQVFPCGRPRPPLAGLKLHNFLH